MTSGSMFIVGYGPIFSGMFYNFLRRQQRNQENLFDFSVFISYMAKK